ncbi:MAG: response regulator [Proteobacteria bacterium]|nr:response regulator [Pseudomonadota bacterium]
MRQLTRLMIIDDELHDIGFMVQFFQEQIEGCSFETFSSAEEALARLHFESEDGDNPVLAEDPDIIILDLKLGAMNGFDFLKVLRKDELTRHIPVIVISGDNSRQSVDQAYEIGANAMFRKPASLDGYRSMISSIVDYWQKTARHAAA